MKLIRKQTTNSNRTGTQGLPSLGFTGEPIDRRTFLRHSGLALGGAALVGTIPFSMMKQARAKATSPKEGVKQKSGTLSVPTALSAAASLPSCKWSMDWSGARFQFPLQFRSLIAPRRFGPRTRSR